MEGLRERLLTEKGGDFQSGPSLKKRGGFGTKITKKRISLKGGLLEKPRSEKWKKEIYIFEKRSLSEQSRLKKWSLRTQAEKWGLFGGTYLCCPNIGVTSPPPAPPAPPNPPRATDSSRAVVSYWQKCTKYWLTA